MNITRFEEIKAWQHAKQLTLGIYNSTNGGAFSRDYGLRDQIRRASVSVMANIAEGFGRNSNKDFVRFLNISRASCFEVQSHLHIAKELDYINEEQFNLLYEKCSEIARLTGGFIKYLKENSAPN